MLQLAKTQPNHPDIKRATLAERLISNALWLKQHGLPLETEQMNIIKEELTFLSESAFWPMRAYAAAIIMQHPKLIDDPKILKKLREDDDSNVTALFEAAPKQ